MADAFQELPSQLFGAAGNTSCLAWCYLCWPVQCCCHPGSKASMEDWEGQDVWLGAPPSSAWLLFPALPVSPSPSLLRPGDLSWVWHHLDCHATLIRRPPSIATGCLVFPSGLGPYLLTLYLPSQNPAGLPHSMPDSFCSCNPLPLSMSRNSWSCHSATTSCSGPTRALSGRSRPFPRCPKNPHRLPTPCLS